MPLAQIVPQKDGDFDLQVQGGTVLHLSKEALGYIPDEVRDDLLSGSAQVGDALVYLVLAAARAGAKFGVNHDALTEVFAASSSAQGK